MINEADKLARQGFITASRMQDVLAVSKRDGKPLKAREDYLAELVMEKLTGVPVTLPVTIPMQWGIDNEAFARAAYEAETGVLVDEARFTITQELAYVGASPDGLIATDGGLEIKCPWNSLVHMRTILNGMPEEHIPQIQCGLWATGRQWWDFVSYDPRMPEKLRLYVQRVRRDQDYIDVMQAQCKLFYADVMALYEQLMEKAA